MVTADSAVPQMMRSTPLKMSGSSSTWILVVLMTAVIPALRGLLDADSY